MPLPTIPIAIMWIFAAAAALGALAGVLAFFISDEGTITIIVVLTMFVALLLIPYLPDHFKVVKGLKRKLRHILREETDDAD